MLLGFRIPYQQRTFYVVAVFWLLILTVGVYRYFGPRSKLLEPVVTYELFNSLEVDVKTRRIFKICNPTQEIVTGDEGLADPKQRWVLKGLLVLIRHGDRGPLQHIQNISNINCGTPDNDLLTSYKSYLHNLTSAGRVSWIGPGSFHGFPLLPSHERQCQLGQLTMQGVNQLLHLGHVLRRTYAPIWPRLRNLTQYEVSVYSTRYRRTFQSALAFLYGFVNADTLGRIAILESQSMYFCFKDCGCQVTERYLKLVQKDIAEQLRSHPAIGSLAEDTSQLIFLTLAGARRRDEDPHAIKDALLTYVCHGSKLPCLSAKNCIKRQNIVGIFAYTDWVSHQKWKNYNWRRLCLLRSYGLIRHIVSQMLAMFSGPYFILYSGHDHTIEHLSATLGLQNDPLLLRYGARLIFEVYHDSDEQGATGLHFRLLANGRDVTRQVSFCKNLVPISDKASLCKIEDIVRFLHDDYFSMFNVTNIKDACFQKL